MKRKSIIQLLVVCVAASGIGPLLPLANPWTETEATALAQDDKKRNKAKKAGKGNNAKKHRGKTGGPGVRSQFDKAQKLFRAGKYQQALFAYHAILTKYPGHEPSTIQYAKTLYRLDRIKESYSMFARINPMHLDAETSYEYGWSFYTHQQWEGALYAFKRVPQGHALFDLANYYGAICAMKLEKFEESEDMLEKAVVLPDKLSKSRSLYLKHVQELLLQRQRRELTKERNKLKGSGGKKGKKGKKDKKDKPAPPPAPVDEKYSHAGFKTVSQYASMLFANNHQVVDKHGYETQTFDAQVATFEFGTGPLAPLPMKAKKGRQAAVGLQLWLGFESYISEGKEERVIVRETNEDLARVEVEDLGTSDSKSGKVSAAPWIEFPLPEEVWLAIGGDFYAKYPEFEEGDRSGSRSGYFSLSGKVPKFSYNGALSYSEAFDSETKPVITTIKTSGSMTFTLSETLSTIIGLAHKRFDYTAENADGPDSSTSASATVYQSLPFGMAVEAFGAYELQSNYIVNKLEDQNGASVEGTIADGQVRTGKVAISVAPFPWFSLGLYYLVAKTKWEVENPNSKDAFELKKSDYVEEFSANININM